MEENIILLLKQLSLALEQRGRNRLKHSELSPSQSFVLDYLFSQQDGAVYAAKLRAKLGLSKSALSSLLKDLQKKRISGNAPQPGGRPRKAALPNPPRPTPSGGSWMQPLRSSKGSFAGAFPLTSWKYANTDCAKCWKISAQIRKEDINYGKNPFEAGAAI